MSGSGSIVKRFDVYLINLNPTIGGEIRKTRPCVIISPDEMNGHIRTVIIAPMTTAVRKYPSRITCKFQKKTGQIVLDQIRTVDTRRLVKKMGRIDRTVQQRVLATLQEMFAE